VVDARVGIGGRWVAFSRTTSRISARRAPAGARPVYRSAQKGDLLLAEGSPTDGSRPGEQEQVGSPAQRMTATGLRPGS